jgi:TolA-binding protein
LKQLTKKIQPYSVADGEYATLVEFALEASQLLDRSYKPASIWSERVTEGAPEKSETTHFSFGVEPNIMQICHEKNYGDDNVVVTCTGLPQGMQLELNVRRVGQESRKIEIYVTGPDSSVEMILERFEKRFERGHVPQEKELEYSLQTARAAITVHAWRAAEQNAQQALRHDPVNPEAMMYMGIAKAAQGYEPEGEGLLLASLTLDPQNAETYYNLGLIVLKQGRCILANNAFSRGLAIEPTSHTLLYHLGQTFERLGALNEALEAYYQALRHSPNSNQVWELTGMDFTLETKDSITRIQGMSKNKKVGD